MKLFRFAIITFLTFGINSYYAESQNTDSNKVETPISKPEEPFSYPGGNDSLQAFFKRNLVYPPKARANRLKGVVKVSYNVNIDGTTSDVKVLQNLGLGCGEEAVRIVKLLKFNPGYAPEKRSIDVPFRF
ncbi:MAG: hypothetical protein A3H98_08565 [Bacteroidetes bacterium RIFCSPLOWO2_02_FULL_36_8]|nr:MAG: hypothetical protein A3H98_08565 [Bacteroidetes bacterium RIFCSPLOWO2_02_FULL_36_8]OFY72093.1 MAG: hypothetical protein A3G23_06950 [Bacteroidetes bacterium RIFCSPLOWO2_12_FULL_37_12]